jgi:putative ABC transport system permease protein
MTLGRMVVKSMRQHALSTLVTAVSIALACGLLMSVWSVKEQARATFTQVDAGFDAVLGARSSKLQLVLNAIFHLEASPANISSNDVATVRRQPGVELAVPIAMGDNFRGYRVVGTTTNLFTDTEFVQGRRYELAAGRWFDPGFKEAVVGSFAAKRLGLKYGDKFQPYHGINFVNDDDHEHEDEYIVVGVLEPSNTPTDRVIWIPLEGVQHMSGHAEETASDVSAVLVKLRTPMAGQALDQIYNKKGSSLTFAWPIGATMADLFNKIGWFDRILALVAGLVAIVSAGSILTSIYNSMNERRRQIAILRALGARRTTVAWTVVLEAMGIAALGSLLGFAIYVAIMQTAAAVLREQTGVVLEVFVFQPVFWWAPLGLIALSSLAGIVPAIKAYRTDVAANLSPMT